MTTHEAIQFKNFTPRDKIPSEYIFRFDAIMERAAIGIKPDETESKFVQMVYRMCSAGDKESQPFKAYRRPTSWGIK